MGLKSWSSWQQGSAGHKEGQHGEPQVAPPVPPSAAIPGEALGCASVQMSSGVIDYLFHSFGNLLSSCAEGALMPCKLCSLSDGSIVYSVLRSGEGLYTPCAVSTVGGLGSLGFSLICSPKQWFTFCL